MRERERQREREREPALPWKHGEARARARTHADIDKNAHTQTRALAHTNTHAHPYTQANARKRAQTSHLAEPARSAGARYRPSQIRVGSESDSGHRVSSPVSVHPLARAATMWLLREDRDLDRDLLPGHAVTVRSDGPGGLCNHNRADSDLRLPGPTRQSVPAILLPGRRRTSPFETRAV